MENLPPCPHCHSIYTYENGDLLVCPECSHEWNPMNPTPLESDDKIVVLDINGNELQSGDAIIIVKDLPVKGAPKPLKAGTRVKNIRLVDGDHNIDCKIDGFGAMCLKSEFVRKA